MRNFVALLACGAMFCGLAAVGAAQESAPRDRQPARNTLSKADRVAFAKLQIKMHRKTADLIEAQIEDEPDKEKIEKLQKELAEIRAEMRKLLPAPMPFDGRPGWGRDGDRRRGGFGPGPGFGPDAGDEFGPGPMGRPGFGPGRMGPPGMGPAGPGVPPPPPEEDDEEQDY